MVAVTLSISPRHMGHSSVTCFCLLLTLLLVVGAFGEIEEDEVVVVDVEEEDDDSLTPVISSSSGLMGDGGLLVGNTPLKSCLIWSLMDAS